MSELISKRRRDRRVSFLGLDPILSVSVFLLLSFGVVLVYAATRDWFASNNLDPQYYLKRQIINVIIGIALAFGATLIDYRLLRAYTPIVWGDRKSTRLNSSHVSESRMPSSA